MCNKATVHPFDQDLWDRAQHPSRSTGEPPID
jgi:hypothetical protein